MNYLLLIVEPVEQRESRGLEAGKEAYAQMQRFTESLAARGVLEASNSLSSQADARRVQLREGRARVIDGPFAEAKEMVGGFFLLDVDSADEALAIAKACPAAAWATVEVRRVAPCYE